VVVLVELLDAVDTAPPPPLHATTTTAAKVTIAHFRRMTAT
jgi:hypothetical protein